MIESKELWMNKIKLQNVFMLIYMLLLGTKATPQDSKRFNILTVFIVYFTMQIWILGIANPTFSQYCAALTLTSVEWGMQKRKGIQLSVLTLCPCIKFTINTILTNQSVIMPPTVLKSLWYVCRLIVFNKYLGNSSRIWPLVRFSVSKQIAKAKTSSAWQDYRETKNFHLWPESTQGNVHRCVEVVEVVCLWMFRSDRLR